MRRHPPPPLPLAPPLSPPCRRTSLSAVGPQPTPPEKLNGQFLGLIVMSH
jgi:hypothetical protein